MKKIIYILFTSILCLSSGVVIAYYNTSSFGYDNANLVSLYDDGVQIMDFDIKYEDVQKTADNILKKLPDRFITI